MACAESPSSVDAILGPVRRVLAGELTPLRAGCRCRHHGAQLVADVGKGGQHLVDAARHRPRLLGPAGLLPDGHEIDELALPNVVADDEAAVAGPLVHIAVVIILRQRVAGRQRPPAHRSDVARAFAAEHAGANRRADAVAADDDVGFGAGAVRKCQAGRAVAGFDRRASLAELDARPAAPPPRAGDAGRCDGRRNTWRRSASRSRRTAGCS